MTAGRHVQKGHATSSRLRDTALALFAEQGFDATTVEQIATSSGVTSRTFFRHFSSKDDVLFDAEARLGQARRLLHDRPEGEDILWSVREVIREMENFHESDRELLRQLLAIVEQSDLAAARAAQLDLRYTGLIAEFVAARRPELGTHRTHVLGFAILGAARIATQTWFLSGATADPLEHLDAALEHVRPVADLPPEAV